MSTPEPGWYDDGSGAMRWWDGSGWRDREAEPPGEPTGGENPPAPTPDAGRPDPAADDPAVRSSSGRWVLLTVIGLVAAMVAVMTIITVTPLTHTDAADGGVALSDEERTSAEELVRAYGAAWGEVDCHAFLKVTTAEFRDPAGMEDCSVFEAQAEWFATSAEQYEIEVTDVRLVDSRLIVSTTETFTAIADAAGIALARPVRDSIDYEYLIVADDAQWTIREIDVVAAPGGPSPGSSAAPSPSPAEVAVPDDALAKIRDFDQALFSADCDTFVGATTAHYREMLGVDECSRFSAAARERARVVGLSVTAPTSGRAVGRGIMIVDAGVVQESLIDEHGAAVADPVVLDLDYRFHLIRSAGEWRIDDLHDVSDDRGEGKLLRDEQTAVDATMDLWRRAYSRGDCDAAMASTTPHFRDLVGWTDCAAIQGWLADVAGLCELDTHVDESRYSTRVGAWHGVIFVDVIDTCRQDVTETGEPIQPPYEAGFPYRYHLIPVDGTWKIDDSSDGAAAEDVPSSQNEQAAVDAIKAYDAAWYTQDCHAYFQATSRDLRDAFGFSTCEEFVDASAEFAATFSGVSLVSTDIERLGSYEMQIKVRETYQARYDVLGRPMDPPGEVEDYVLYTVRAFGAGWVVDEVTALL